MRVPRPLPMFAALVLAAALPAHADEGMWTLDNLPVARLRERYGFTPSAAWVEHVQRACVNFGGASGAFVSSDGLVLTNHHVALGQLQKMSSPEHDYVHDGFFARTPAEEMACPDLELKVLWSMENVTAAVNAAIDPTTPTERQNEQRKAALARLEQESTQKTGLKTEGIELYQGGEYWLYRYHTYKDVRLVCAPEEQAAFYGGDLDNFSFPRHDLDFAFFRIYENGQPVHPEHYLRWSAKGVGEGDLVMVVGHPGRTDRDRTVAQLEYARDVERPLRIRIQELRERTYRAYAAQGPEQARQTVTAVRQLENNLKRERGFLDILSDPVFLARRRTAEATMRARVAKNPALEAKDGGAWDAIATAEREQRTQGRARTLRDLTRLTRLTDIATGIVRFTAEAAKPNERRFKEYRDANLGSQRFALLSPAPIYPAMEEKILAAHLQMCLDSLGPSDPFVKAALDGQSPTDAVHALVAGTHLADVAERKRLLEGGVAAVEASSDPLIVWARRIDGAYRDQRKWFEDRVESVEALEGARIAHARFALDGRSTYPDATGTLRLSYGKVAGYSQLTTEVPWKTTFYGLYDRADSFDGREPFELPKRVAAAAGSVDLSTPLDFVCTDDIIGGNSGSPVVDRNGDYVGLVFDGNIQSFIWTFAYSDAQARCVSVDSRALVLALRRIYDMGALADELTRSAN
ncbi:MAG TPA: S46 family peptidase [Candidatus Acidoferrales bacterium]|nr:S46 family peptidase [Candidatus Acidoferrales bacterium]